jgi:calpain-15
VKALFPKSNAITGKLGCYEVRLCDAGQWVTVTVDDYFPCFPVDGGGPVFSQSHGNELWVLLLEKAFAKVRGSYASLRYGYSLEALIDLTGAPFHHFNLQQELNRDDELSLWGKVLEYDLKGYVMTGSTAGWDEASEAPLSGGDRGGDPVLNQGLVLGHAYTILEAKETSTGVRLLKLRNPWYEKNYILLCSPWY